MYNPFPPADPRTQIREMIKHGYTYNDAVRDYRDGGITQACFDRWLRLWTWGAPRFSGCAGAAQDSYYNVHGDSATQARIMRVKRAVQSILQTR